MKQFVVPNPVQLSDIGFWATTSQKRYAIIQSGVLLTTDENNGPCLRDYASTK